jgi:hypothetical protein
MRGVEASKIMKSVPHEFHRVVDQSQLKAGPYTVISFPGMRGESSSIVDSKTLSKALAKVPATDQIVAIAHNFTAEARELLSRANALCFFTSDFFWSDESWAHIRDKR